MTTEEPLQDKVLESILNSTPKKEEDVPIGMSDRSFWSDVNCLKEIKEIYRKTQDAIKDNKSFVLVYVCILAIIAVYIFQALVSTEKEITTSVIELLKGIIFAATGYIFAKNA